MLVKLKAGDARKQSFAQHIASQAQDNGIVRAAGHMFRRRLEMKLSDIDAAKQTTREFSLINQLLATCERQRRAPILLRVCERKQAHQHSHNTGCLVSDAKLESTRPSHLK